MRRMGLVSQSGQGGRRGKRRLPDLPPLRSKVIKEHAKGQHTVIRIDCRACIMFLREGQGGICHQPQKKPPTVA